MDWSAAAAEEAKQARLMTGQFFGLGGMGAAPSGGSDTTSTGSVAEVDKVQEAASAPPAPAAPPSDGAEAKKKVGLTKAELSKCQEEERKRAQEQESKWAEVDQFAGYQKVTKFAWDQSDKFVSIYIDWPEAAAKLTETASWDFQDRYFRLCVVEDGKGWILAQRSLCKAIDPSTSKVNIKADKIVVKLAKKAKGQTWSALDDTKDKKEAERKKRIEKGDLQGASTQQLLADMYANCTDEEREGLREAMKKNREYHDQKAKGLVD